MNRSAKRQELAAALTQSSDPYRIASVLTVTSVAPQQRPPEPTGGSSSSEPSLTDAWGNEWATICKSWLDVQECVMAVSRFAQIRLVSDIWKRKLLGRWIT